MLEYQATPSQVPDRAPTTTTFINGITISCLHFHLPQNIVSLTTQVLAMPHYSFQVDFSAKYGQNAERHRHSSQDAAFPDLRLRPRLCPGEVRCHECSRGPKRLCRTRFQSLTVETLIVWQGGYGYRPSKSMFKLPTVTEYVVVSMDFRGTPEEWQDYCRKLVRLRKGNLRSI